METKTHMNEIDLRLGNCLEVMKELDDESVDSIVTDPPYGLSFMGKKWDYDVPSVEIWKECMRVLKPGGHTVAFSSARTYHRMVVNIEDAGFEIRDQIMWVYGTGFPKSHNISKAIDKKAGAEREAQQWDGWGTGLKPAHEPIVLARKPFKATVAENVLKHGTGGLNLDGCRVGTTGARNNGKKADSNIYGKYGPTQRVDYGKGRFPTNFIHDGSDEVVTLFPEKNFRFFYCAKASKAERGEGNNHPTVKPVALMKYLCRLITPPSGIILDPFMGSGTTGIAAKAEGFGFIGIEMTEEYLLLSKNRICNTNGHLMWL